MNKYYFVKTVVGLFISITILFSLITIFHHESSAQQQRFRTIDRWLRGESMPHDYNKPWPEKSPVALEVGKEIFQFRCAVCHGKNGDGNGEAAKDLKIKPRDFRYAVFKFRSTPSGDLPTDEDLLKIISRGIHGTAMVPWVGLTNSQKWLVIYYIKSISGFFSEDYVPMPVSIPKPSKSPQEYIAQGKIVYAKAKCFVCHGVEGRGDGVKAGQLKDDWRRDIQPTNFKTQIFKRGYNIEDTYLTIATGLNGTPMPSYLMSLNPEEMLSIAYYVNSLAPPMQQDPELINQNMKKDELMGLRIDHMQGVRYPMPASLQGGF